MFSFLDHIFLQISNIYDMIIKNNNLVMIVDENSLLEYLKSYPFIDSETKNSFIQNFDTLTQSQILLLASHLNDEKKDILNFLKSFKDKEITNFEEIKTQIDGFGRNKLKLEELLESKKEKNEILDLVKAIDNF